MTIENQVKVIGDALLEKKASEILVLDIRNITVIADYFIICSGHSQIQVRALSDYVEEQLSKDGVTLRRKEGYEPGRWIVLDYGDILVHIFHTEEREFYNLERLWVDGANVKRLDI